jgi:transposase
MIGLAWRLQKESPLVKWFELRTANAWGSRKTMIVALARRLLIAFPRRVAERDVDRGDRRCRQDRVARHCRLDARVGLA